MADNLAVEQWPGAANYKPAAQPQPQKWPGAANYAPAQPDIPKWQGAAQHQPEASAKGVWGALSEETGKILAPMQEPVIEPEERKQAVAKYSEPVTAAMEGLIGAGKLPGAIANVGINAAMEAADKSGLLGVLNKLTGQPNYDPEKQKAEINEALGFGLTASAAAPELTGAQMAREAGRLPPEAPASKPGEAPSPPPINQNAEGRPVVPQGGLPKEATSEAAKPQPWPGADAYKAKGLTPQQDQLAAGAVERAATREAEAQRIVTPAIKTADGKVETGPNHPEIAAKGAKGTPGFVTDKGQFVDRETGAKIAEASGQAKTPIKTLHTEDLQNTPAARPVGASVGAAHTPVHEILEANKAELEKRLKEQAPDIKQRVKAVTDVVKELFAPQTLGPGAKQAESAIMQAQGRATREIEIARRQFDEVRAIVDANTTPEQKLDIIEWLQTPEEAAQKRAKQGLAFEPPESIRPLLELVRTKMVEMRIEMESRPKTERMAFKEDYLHQAWERPDDVVDYLRSLPAKQGSSGFTKASTFQDYREGIKAGFVPKTLDPIEISMRYIENARRFLALNDVIEDGVDAKNIVWRSPEHRPNGWVKLQGRVNSYAAGAGQDAYAPPDFAAVYNAFVSTPIGGAVGKAIAWAQRASNLVTAVNLTLSAYHGTLETGEGISSATGNAIDKLVGGDVIGAAKTAAGAPIKPITSLARGLKVQRAYLNLDRSDPLTNRVVQALTDANFNIAGRGRVADEFRASSLGGFFQSLQRGRLKYEVRLHATDIKSNPITGAFNLATRALDTAMEPIFQYYVPLLKNSAAYDMMNTWLKANPEATDSQLAAKAREVGRMIDARFGEMNHDNLFWQSWLKQIAHLTFLSFSYTYGKAALYGGAALDVAKIPAKLANRSKLLEMTKDPKSEVYGLKPTRLWTSRMSQVVGITVASSLLSAAYQYWKTGKPLGGTQDALHPLTGGTDPSTGKPARASIPSFQTSVLNMLENPGQEIGNIGSVFFKTIWEGIHNADWRGDPIRNPYDPGEKQFMDLFEHVGGELGLPFSLKQQTKGGTNISTAERVFGVREAPMRAVDSDKWSHLQKYESAKAAVTKQHHDINAERAQHGLPPRKWHRTETDRAIRSEMNKYRGTQ